MIPRGGPGRALLVATVLLAAACASAPPGSSSARNGGDAAVAAFSFARDTFAFRNEIRAFSGDDDDLYANYCFVLARGMRQFFLFARFEPDAPRLDHAGYAERVRRIADRAPWRAPIADADRVVIPGYANLREFSHAEEAAVKEGLGGRFWTLMHPTIWRTALPLGGARHQTGIFDEIHEELAAGRLVQLLVTNWPILELNHTVVAFAAHANGSGVELAIWDPNEPSRPGVITFDTTERRFWATRVYATRPQPIRVFRMHYSPLL